MNQYKLGCMPFSHAHMIADIFLSESTPVEAGASKTLKKHNKRDECTMTLVDCCF